MASGRKLRIIMELKPVPLFGAVVLILVFQLICHGKPVESQAVKEKQEDMLVYLSVDIIIIIVLNRHCNMHFYKRSYKVNIF